MENPSASVRELATRLLELEAGGSRDAAHSHDAVRVIETLRASLTRFAGPDGFHVLMRRAIVLSRAEVPTLESVKVNPEGSIEGIHEIAANASEAVTTVIAHLLWLLMTFIGESMTMRLVREAWPEIE